MPDAKVKVKIVDVRTLPSPLPGRTGKMDSLVIFEAGEGNRDIVTVPSEGMTDAALARAIGEKLKSRAAWIGKTLDV